MKKFFILLMLCLTTINIYAQNYKYAVLNFKANVGISQNEVDGISSIFSTYFNPRGWVEVERTQINKVISEQGFQQSSMTESQMVRLGKILNVKKIVIGDVNIINGSYNLDVRIVDVETGLVSAKDGAAWTGSNYRGLMQSLGTRLASKIAITQTSTSSKTGSSQSTYSTTTTTTKPVVAPSSSATNVITLYGYLKIYPKNLGVFTSEPTSVISNINKNGDYNYNTWRIPTKEEWELIVSNANKVPGISADQPYMTSYNRSDGKQKVVRLVTTDTKTFTEKKLEEQEAERKAEIARQEAERKAEIARQEAERKAEIARQEAERKAEIARQEAERKRQAEYERQALLNTRRSNPRQAVKDELGLDIIVKKVRWGEVKSQSPTGYRLASDNDLQKMSHILSYMTSNPEDLKVITSDCRITEEWLLSYDSKAYRKDMRNKYSYQLSTEYWRPSGSQFPLFKMDGQVYSESQRVFETSSHDESYQKRQCKSRAYNTVVFYAVYIKY